MFKHELVLSAAFLFYIPYCSTASMISFFESANDMNATHIVLRLVVSSSVRTNGRCTFESVVWTVSAVPRVQAALALVLLVMPVDYRSWDFRLLRLALSIRLVCIRLTSPMTMTPNTINTWTPRRPTQMAFRIVSSGSCPSSRICSRICPRTCPHSIIILFDGVCVNFNVP
ncbi:hypothetical protein B0J13DRAFT_542280 [Dactylonectria estremocensis]|uniref:Secreted protein n=1 Tax=Dactylonectria estremocensis TaxID=1079267 RepID=A0A9P9FCV2_9HYPO|nr:hypothetical protein B0J13DRAFT_542280 [Dactylonectria estremocensis]